MKKKATDQGFIMLHTFNTSVECSIGLCFAASQPALIAGDFDERGCDKRVCGRRRRGGARV